MLRLLTILALVVCSLGCNKKLEEKPSSQLVLPQTIKDFENMLDNTEVMNLTTALPQMSADEYYIPSEANFNSIVNPIPKSVYIWDQDIFKGASQVRDWGEPYAQVFICNSVLDKIAQLNSSDPEMNRVKGWALFNRAYAFYTLVSTFAKGYDMATASTDPGIPLKLSSGITEIVGRSSVQDSYDRIIADALDAAALLQSEIPATRKNRPSKVAAYALLARVSLSMRKYQQAESYAVNALSLYNKLTDYNTLPVSPTVSSWVDRNGEEVIYFSRNENAQYSATTYTSGALYGVDTLLRSLYAINDLRRTVYFRINANGNWALSKGINTPIGYPFTGLATDEMYMIKAECAARAGRVTEGMKYLNDLLRTRYKTSTYTDMTAVDAVDALDKILIERRKELIWRCLRWTDLKRLNLEGRNIVLTRRIGTQVYTLQPNSPLYVLPIPDDEVRLSGIQQNAR